jgi:hypothetical protein
MNQFCLAVIAVAAVGLIIFSNYEDVPYRELRGIPRLWISRPWLCEPISALDPHAEGLALVMTRSAIMWASSAHLVFSLLLFMPMPAAVTRSIHL